MTAFGPLVSADWLRTHVNDPDIRVIDFRWYLDGRSGREAYLGGHIPGAVYVDLSGDVTGHQEGAGRHPLPEADAFAREMRQAGVGSGSRVVAYDDEGGFVAGRLWWMLRYFGHDAVALLDGGLPAWGTPLSTEDVQPAPGDFVAGTPRDERKVDYEDVRALRGGDTLLIDARAGERYRGDVEPMDPQPGHIPGARSAPWAGNLAPSGRFRSPEELRQRFERLGVRGSEDVVAYCGSGVSACHNLIALEVAGLPGARLYPGSWSDWSARDDAPVATGPQP